MLTTWDPVHTYPDYYWICNFSFPDEKISTLVHTKRIQIKFASPHVSGFILSSSANFTKFVIKSDFLISRAMFCRTL